MHSTVTVTNKSRATGTCHHVSFLAWYGQRGRGYLPLALPPRSRWSCAEGSKWKLCWKCSPSASWSLRAPAPRTAHRGGCAGGVLTLSLCTGQGTSIVPPAWCVRIFCFSETVKSKGRRGSHLKTQQYHFSTYSHRRDAASCGDHAPFPYLSTARPRPSHTQTMTKTHRTRHRHMQEINNKAPVSSGAAGQAPPEGRAVTTHACGSAHRESVGGTTRTHPASAT